MHTGTIATRYARALLTYATETGGSGRVCAQIEDILAHPGTPPPALEPELQRLAGLLEANGRLEMARSVFREYVRLYYESERIILARLRTAAASPELEEKLRSLLESRFGRKVIFRTVVDPGLIGGFVVETDSHRIDASVRRRIDTIRRQFIIQNNRLV